MRDSELSDSEFERIEDNLDAREYQSRRMSPGREPAPATFAAWQNSRAANARIILVVAATVAIAAAVLIATGGSGAQRPSCAANSAGCRMTSDGVWVPVWYYGGLAAAQGIGGGRAPLSTGAQPSTAQLENAGASESEADSAESYANSVAGDSDGDQSDDSSGSSDDGDDSAGDDGGGGGDGS